MDPTQKFNLTFISESSQVVTEETYPDDSGASQNFSETLIKNLSKLTLNTSTEFPSPLPEGSLHPQSTGAAILREIGDDLPYRRRGVRTLLSVKRERLARFRYMLLGRGASQNFSETLIKNLSKLTLNTSTEFPSPLPEGSLHPQSTGAAILREIGDDLPYRRRGVRTLLSVKRERLARFRYMLLGRGPVQPERTLTNTGLKGVKSASRRGMFKCPCSFCESSGWDPSENARMGNYDTKPLQP
nr:developmental pluripotency-associated protein 3-like [Aotus nancymaae]